ncbi:MAG: putative zinc-binding metallopeptidase, partial [Candidatus Omnitrophica bacterium]|nr:putative zinc-binding metallopeptidase [Candidatus Omnitrophota bacterium]
MAPKNIDLNNISEEDLLKQRICDLPISIAGTWLEDCINQLYKELESKGINFKPVCYLSDEWLTPQNEPVIGIPFYLAHPALTKLEKKMMLEAEGETRDLCMKLLRHETGHAISYAYKLQRKKKWKELFGPPSKEYADTYRFRPYSKNFVRHLEGFYAQLHPDEDFVETFAVWLTPGLDWEKEYQGWKALKKLRYVDHLIKSLKEKAPAVEKGVQFWNAGKLKITLKNFYKRKQKLRAEDFPAFYDGNLKEIFVERTEELKDTMLATDILRKYRAVILKDIAKWTGERKYVVGDVF